jgi:hypothetical protein
MGPDRLALHRAGDAEHRQLVHGDGEVVAPEMHQSLEEAAARAYRRIEAGQHLGPVGGCIQFADRAHRAALLAIRCARFPRLRQQLV